LSASSDNKTSGPAVETIAGLCDLIINNAANSKRYMVAFAGPPASGKSTVAEHVAHALKARGESATVVPMDGFHYDDAVLSTLGLRSRKGSPPTFDCTGFESLLKRLKSLENNVAIPVFDRSMELARAGAELIPADTKFLIIEGNYLLLDEEPWSHLRPLFDLTVSVEVDRQTLEDRLYARWNSYGKSAEDARSWIESNDLPNIRHVLEHNGTADIRFDNN
jgi:pantothenate kinase